MTHKLNYPTSETEFRGIQDALYKLTKIDLENGVKPCFKGLVEVAFSETVIVSAVHKIKANKGSETPGSDKTTMSDLLQMEYEDVINLIQEAFLHYKPKAVRRVYIPKPGKTEKRPLGIPSITDRVIQECVRMTIEPIFEAQFFKHSYGFRPLRSAQHAIERLAYIVRQTGFHWIVEGDIRKFFDRVNHAVMMNTLYNMGIHDRRMLMIISKMLKAGVMGETEINELGTPQGGIISPLLANAYLHNMDKWIAREWEDKKLRVSKSHVVSVLRNYSNLKPAFLVRYADDWVLVTDSKEHAYIWRHRIKEYLSEQLKFELSEEKTLITKITKKPIQFLGYSMKFIPGKAKQGYLPSIKPNPERLELKVQYIRDQLKRLTKCTSKEFLIADINRINSIIRGILQYYQNANVLNLSMRKYREIIKYASYKALKQFGGEWVPVNKVSNLAHLFPERTEQVPAIKYDGMYIGIMSVGFSTFIKHPIMNQDETPYSEEGRKLTLERTKKQPVRVRADELFFHSTEKMERIALTGYGHQGIRKARNKLDNFEFIMNRPYAFNRDKGKCRVCSDVLIWNVEIHHNSPKLPANKVNKVQNLTTLCERCHKAVHGSEEHCGELNTQQMKKVLKLREKLGALE